MAAPSDAALARWIASRLRKCVGCRRPAAEITESLSGTVATLARTSAPGS
jgi:hypothetical protein